MTTTPLEFVTNTGQFLDQTDNLHEVVLNKLGNWHTNQGRRRFYDPDEFRKVTDEFNKTYLVFAKEHPQNINKIPIDDALAEVEGRLVGTPQDVMVTKPGTALFGKLRITDPEVEQLLKEGKAHISTAFNASVDAQGKYFNIVPNHILIYPTGDGAPEPGDQAALVLNQASDGDIPEKETVEIDTMVEKNDETTTTDLAREMIQNQSAKIDAQTVKLTEQSETITNQKTRIGDLEKTVSEKDSLIATKEELITNQATEITNLKGDVATLKQTIADMKTATRKAKREAVFNSFLPGTKKAFEARKETDLMDEDKYDDLVAEMSLHQAQAKAPKTEESGDEFESNQDKKPKIATSVEMKFDDKGRAVWTPVYEEV